MTPEALAHLRRKCPVMRRLIRTHGPCTLFKLGRPDVLPADDFGVRNGFRLAFDWPALPTAKELLAYGEAWRPHATTAAWYLWRAADAANK